MIARTIPAMRRPADRLLVPEQLREQPFWVTWRFMDKGRPKLSKVPVDPQTLSEISWNDPARWMTFGAAMEAAERDDRLGIGIVLSDADPFAAVDLDDAFDEAGEMRDWAQTVFENVDGWAELSVSGTGLHFIGTNGDFVGRCRKELEDGGNIERYCRNRFLTVSGDVFRDEPMADFAQGMAWLAAKHFPEDARISQAARIDDDDPELTAELARVCMARLSPQRAYNGDDWRRVGYALRSCGDALEPEWMTFSKQWPECDEAECRDRWRRFRPVQTGRGSLLGMASEDSATPYADLFAEARRRLGRDSKPAATNGQHAAGVEEAESAEPALEWEPFPLESLPVVLRDYAVEAATAMGVDVAFVAVPMLPVVAAAVGSSTTIELKAGWTEPAILWAATVGESGSGKSPGFRAATGPLHELDEENEGNNELLATQHAAEVHRYKAALAAWNAEAKKNPGQAGDPPTDPGEFIEQNYCVGDITVEALGRKLNGNPRGLILVEDELSTWLASFDRYSAAGKSSVSADAPKWLKVHGAERLIIDRNSRGRVSVARASCGVVGGIQPEVLWKALGSQHVSNGLAARILLAHPPRKQVPWTEQEPCPRARQAYLDCLRLLYAIPDDAGRRLRLSPEAKAAWVTFHNQTEELLTTLAGPEASVVSKSKATAARLALVFHAARCATDNPLLGDEVTVEDMEAAITLARWFVHEWRRAWQQHSGRAGGAAGLSDADALLEWLERQPGGVSASKVSGAGPAKLRGQTDRIDRAISELVQTGRVVSENQPNARGPSTRFIRAV